MIAEQQPNFPFVILAPQCPEGEDWTTNPPALIALLDDILRRYRIDPERVYLTGTSMGGNGTWYLASIQPKYFAAIAPLAAKPTIPTIREKQFISMPIWACHGEKDPICPTPRFTILPDQGVNSMIGSLLILANIDLMPIIVNCSLRELKHKKPHNVKKTDHAKMSVFLFYCHF